MSSASDIATRVGRGAALLVLGEILLRGVGLINLPILARLLGPEDFGIIAAATFVLGLSEALTRLPMGAALIRHEQLYDTHFNTAFTLTALRGLFLGAIIFASAEAAADLFRDPTVKPVLQWLAIGPILMGLENPRFVLFEKRLEFRKPAMIGVLAAAGGAIIAILLAVTLRNYWALVGSALSQRFIQIFLSYYWLPHRPAFGLRHVREFLTFGGWLTGASIVNYINFKSDALLIGRFLGAGTLGLYTFGNRIAEMITHDLAAPFARALYPGLAEIKTDSHRLADGYLRAQAAILGLVLPFGLGAALVAKELVLLVGGEQWLPTLPVIQFLAPVMAVGIVNAGVTSLVMATGETRRLFYRSLINFLLRVPPMILGLFTLGFMGVVYARVFSGLANTVVTLQLAKRATGLAWSAPFRASWRSWVSCAVMSTAIMTIGFYVPSEGGLGSVLYGLTYKVVGGGAAYVACHLLLWLVSGREDGLEAMVIERLRTLTERAVQGWKARRRAKETPLYRGLPRGAGRPDIFRNPSRRE